MEVVPRSRRRTGLVEEEEHLDYISLLPNTILEDIVSLLPTKDSARMQVLSSRWSKIWCSAPLNLDLDSSPNASSFAKDIPGSVILSILSIHKGPVRRFSIPKIYLNYRDNPAMTLDSWLQSSILKGLQELDFQHDLHYGWIAPLHPLPTSVHRFSSTLRVAGFGNCNFMDGNSNNGLHFPLLKQLALSDVTISESSIHALLVACPTLESLLLAGKFNCSRIQIASPALRSIDVHPGNFNFQLPQIVIEDAPFLERLLCFKSVYFIQTYISVILAPKLHALGAISAHNLRLKFGTTIFQAPGFVSLNTVVQSVNVLALTQKHLSLDAIIDFVKCFPSLEKLYIKTKQAGEKNVWFHKYRNLIGTLEFRLKIIVLTKYHGNTSYVNFAKFFVLNARILESMRLELSARNPSSAWIDKQHRLLQIKNKASRDMHLDFVSNYYFTWPYPIVCAEQVHNLSIADPFLEFHDLV